MRAKRLTRETIRLLGIPERKLTDVKVGDTVAVSQRIKEGEKERIQIFEGDVIAIQNNGVSSTFTVRKISANSVSVERVFPFYSPLIESIEFIRAGKVRRAKLYYMRGRVGRASRVREKVLTRAQREQEIRTRNPQASEPIKDQAAS